MDAVDAGCNTAELRSMYGALFVSKSQNTTENVADDLATQPNVRKTAKGIYFQTPYNIHTYNIIFH